MVSENVYKEDTNATIGGKVRDYIQLGKLRLSLTVVFSAGMAYLIAGPEPTPWPDFIAFLCGGLLITLAANAFNQIIEVNTDSLMKRTAPRPLPGGRMEAKEAFGFAVGCALLGSTLLAVFGNLPSAFIGIVSLILYSFIYTPLKKYGTVAVWAGAVPGALPAIIGWSAATGDIGLGAWALFGLQYLWQLPHFWAINWLAYDDYTKAGFSLLPGTGLRDRLTALRICLYTLPILPLSFLPFYAGICGGTTTLFLLFFSILYFLQTVYLLIKLSRKSALLLMFGSFLYLPAILIAIFIDKL